ncbi:MAG: hypothetical protein ACRCTQ_01175 [Brevinemataceae bacterium]
MKKKIILFVCIGLMVLLLFFSCAFEGEIFRLQNRMSLWNNLLGSDKLQLFAQNELQQLGQLIDQCEVQDTNFAQKLREIRINEAIMSFDGTKTAHFFYHTLLKDLVKFSYVEFINALTSDEIMYFISNKQFATVPFQSDLKKVFDRARNEFEMIQFSDQQILNYYRSILFPGTVYPVVYNVLALLARYEVLESFLQGDISSTMAFFERLKTLTESKRKLVRDQADKDYRNWSSQKQRALLNDFSDEQFLTVLYQYVLPEMNPDVRIRTIDNIKNRFKKKVE